MRVGRSGRRCCNFLTTRVKALSRGNILMVSTPNQPTPLTSNICTSIHLALHFKPFLRLRKSIHKLTTKNQNPRLHRPRRPRRIHLIAPKQTAQEIQKWESDGWIVQRGRIPNDIIVSQDGCAGSASLIFYSHEMLSSGIDVGAG